MNKKNLGKNKMTPFACAFQTDFLGKEKAF